MTQPGFARSPRSPAPTSVPTAKGCRRRLGQALALSILLCAARLPGAPVFAQTDAAGKHFDGPFLGLELGSQNYFSGALVGEVDVLTRSSKIVTDLSVGYRKQLARGRLVVGLRFNYGHTDGQLRNLDQVRQLEFLHRNDSQFGLGFELGVALGSRRSTALFLYGYETERDFEVTIATPAGSFRQSDEQGVFRFGLGVELRLRRGFHLRATLGTDRADFGDRLTSREVDGRTEVGLGVVYQL